MSAPFVPPTPRDPQPDLPEWNRPAATQIECDWAQLRTIELSLLDSPDPAVVQKLVETATAAIKEDGFLYLTNYGVSLEQVHRQFAIAQYLHTNISDEDKQRLCWDPINTGRFAGWKPGFGIPNKDAKIDGIEQFNFYASQFESLDAVPKCIYPFMDEVAAFCTYLHESVNRRLLKLLSKVLELPDDYLWEKVESHGGPVGQGYFRHALFYPLTKNLQTVGDGQRMLGHTDFGTTTLLFSVPISCLQIWGRDQKWRYVKYNPGSLVVNIGETLEIVSAGHFKATRHRVHTPPEDQMGEQRLSIVQFNASQGSLRMEPAYESPLIKREGPVDYQGAFREFTALRKKGMPVPSNKEWREIHIANSHLFKVDPRSKPVLVEGVKMLEREFLGVKILLPV